MKKTFLLMGFMICAYFGFAQVKSDAEMQSYNDTYIRPNTTNAIKPAMHNTLNDYLIQNKIHKDSLDNVRILPGDTCIEITYKTTVDTFCLSSGGGDSYWTLSGDTLGTAYNVKLDSSFLMQAGKWHIGYAKEDPVDGNSDSLVYMGYFDYDNHIFSLIQVRHQDAGGEHYDIDLIADGDGRYSTLNMTDSSAIFTVENSIDQNILKVFPDSTVFRTENIYMPDITSDGGKFEYLVGLDPNGRLFPQPLASGSALDPLCSGIGFQLVPSTTMNVLVKNTSTGKIHTYPLQQFTNTIDTSGNSIWQLDSANNRVYLNESDWKVGIGTNTPIDKLDINGNINLSYSDSTGVIKISGSPIIHFYDAMNLKTNVFIGDSAGNFQENSYYNVGIGVNALRNINIQTAIENTAVGTYALWKNTSGNTNTAIGANALMNNTIGVENQAFGRSCLVNNTIGDRNVAVGESVLSGNTEGSGNIGIGDEALVSNETGDNNIGIGYDALFRSNGDNNIGIGFRSGYNLESGNHNIFIGDSTESLNDRMSYQLNIGNLITGSLIPDSMAITIHGNTHTTGGYSYDDPAPWMDSYRKNPFYSIDFFEQPWDMWNSSSIGNDGDYEIGSEADHPGWVRMKSSKTYNNCGASIFTGANDGLFYFNENMYYECVFYLEDTVDNETFMGFSESQVIYPSPDDMLGLKLMAGENGHITGVVRENGGPVSTSTYFTANDTTWYRGAFKVNANADTVYFYIYKCSDNTLLWSDYVVDFVAPNVGLKAVAAAVDTGTNEIYLTKFDYISFSPGKLNR